MNLCGGTVKEPGRVPSIHLGEQRPARLVHDSEQDNQQLRELEQLMAEKKGATK